MRAGGYFVSRQGPTQMIVKGLNIPKGQSPNLRLPWGKRHVEPFPFRLGQGCSAFIILSASFWLPW